MQPRIFLVAGVVGLASGLAAGCQEAPTAYPQALVFVGTDLPVPAVLSRLRVDVFDGTGTWTETRSFALRRAAEWPASFGIELRDDTRETDVLLRIRGYAEGAERDYVGERFAAKAPFVTPSVPSTLAALCAAAPELMAGEVLVQRAGPRPLFGQTCFEGESIANRAGSVAAYVTIPRRDRYRFATAASVVTARRGLAFITALHLVRDCTRPDQYLACNDDYDGEANTGAQIDVDLDPGRYALVTGAWLTGSFGDVALSWGPVAGWRKPVLPAASDAGAASPPTRLTLARDGVDVTPTVEPSPQATVDRLVRLHLVPGAPVRADIVLRGACAGTMAKLAIDGTHVDLARSATCVSETAVLVEAAAAPISEPPAPLGSFADEPCAPADSDDAVVCVPGDALVLGSSSPSVYSRLLEETPRRIVAVRRFWIDRRELTVRRYRQFLTRGLHGDTLERPRANEGPLAETEDPLTSYTWSERPGLREDHPLNGLRWDAARSVCKFAGGDLPSEAQWEHVASAGKEVKNTFPWGGESTACDRTVMARGPNIDERSRCPGTGPVSVGHPDVSINDLSYLGVEGLGGNVSELVLGSARSYADPCWEATPVIDPVCLDETDPDRVARGAQWSAPAYESRTTTRSVVRTSTSLPGFGFRCAYASRPEAP